jgi:hypothetical protein
MTRNDTVYGMDLQTFCETDLTHGRKMGTDLINMVLGIGDCDVL